MERKKVEKTFSITDPEAGMLRRPGKPAGMHYLSHQSVDTAHGIVVDVAAAPGNTSGSEPYLARIELCETIWDWTLRKQVQTAPMVPA